jgi:hypothetical protein
MDDTSDGGARHACLLQSAWIELLQRYWMQWFVTMTFSIAVHPEAALKKWRVWVSKLNRELYGPRWYLKGHTQVLWVLAIERQKRGVLHFHALVGDARDLNHRTRRLRWKDEWESLAGFARIEAIRSEDEVRGYITKYVTKGGEIELSPSLRFATTRGNAQLSF